MVMAISDPHTPGQESALDVVLRLYPDSTKRAEHSDPPIGR